jgi:hypothetical protein
VKLAVAAVPIENAFVSAYGHLLTLDFIGPPADVQSQRSEEYRRNQDAEAQPV